MKNHIICFTLGFILDLILGDPYWIPHPVRFIGKTISIFENKLLNKEDNSKQKRLKGLVLVLLVCLLVEIIVISLLIIGYKINVILGCVIETIMTYQMLATKCLKVESMKVYYKLENGTLEEARKAVSMIVGRDTDRLTDEEITKAAVETVAENTSDGIIAPMLYLALGGPILGFLYKSINTMDSMIGYKNDKYIDFGRFAAKLDDVVNFIPSRVSAILMIFSCLLLGKSYNQKNAIKIYKRDRYKHESPNSAQTESVCAGALSVQLAGPSYYEGKIENKPYIGEPIRKIEYVDIKRVNKLLYCTAIVCCLICICVMGIFILI